MKKIILLLITASFLASCSDFLNTAPYDQISSETFWKTEDDARKAVVGCYSDFASGSQILYLDCMSDIAFNAYEWEGGYAKVGNGTVNASADANRLVNFYDYTTIRCCNTFLANVEKIEFKDPAEKSYLIAQVRVIRAYKYALMNQWYGGVPLVTDLVETAAEAQLPRKSPKEIYDYVLTDINAAIADLKLSDAAGRITKGTALALKMRTALLLNDYATALDAAKAIEALGRYELEPKYGELFALTGKGSKEIIHATQYMVTVASFGVVGQMYNNGDNGGWSSIVPTQNLVDMYEMANGQSITEAGSGYDAVHPYADRDPRFYASILYPGRDWVGPGLKGVYNTLDAKIGDETNPNDPNDAGSKTSLTWGKYLFPGTQYKDMWDTDACPILYRYAEVLLTIAECNVEMDNGDLGIAADYLDKIRNRAGMPAVDRAKYGSKETMRELVRRERTIELAGEGVRRQDILRWDDGTGKMVAQTVMPGTLTRITGTVDNTVADETKRAKITVGETEPIEVRKFETYMKFLPFPQGELDKNKQLKQNAGY